jgi:hypothetical protein
MNSSTPAWSVRQGSAAWDHRLPARVDGLDDLGVVDALRVDGRDADVAVTELALADESATRLRA